MNEVAQKDHSAIQMLDGTIVDFGKKGQIKREFSFGENGAVTVDLALITGRRLSVTLTPENPVYSVLAARGAAEYISNSVAGVYSDKDGTHPEDFDLAIDEAISQLNNGVLSTRQASENLKGYGDLIRAMMEIRSAYIDPNTGEHKFAPEDCTYDAVKAVVLNSEEVINKARMKKPEFAVLIEKYRMERQQARVARLSEKSSSIDELDNLL